MSKNCGGSHLWPGWCLAGQRKQRPEARRCWSCSGDNRAVGKVVGDVTGAGNNGKLGGDVWLEVAINGSTADCGVELDDENCEEPSLSSTRLDKPYAWCKEVGRNTANSAWISGLRPER
ncbi:hypothetical protein Hdeb2414_s0010g00346231 [Helianthus debilis subsp. tardiflorus]